MERRRYRESFKLTKKFGTSYFIATLLLDSTNRRHVYALYSLCRSADDLVDVADGHPGMSETARVDLQKFKDAVYKAIEENCDEENLFGAIAQTWNELDLDHEYLDRFFSAMEMDLDVTRYDSHEDLALYTDGSAAVIGEMVLPILVEDVSSCDELRHSAQSLGIAFQLTNFLRDVGEDLERGRIYIPMKSFANCGVDPENIEYNSAFISLMKSEIAYTRGIYSEALPGIQALTGRRGACVRTAFRLYSQILNEIERVQYDVLNQRVHVPQLTKYSVAGREFARANPSTFRFLSHNE